MAKSIDRRASKKEEGVRAGAEEQRIPLDISVEKAAGVQRHKDGSIRRITSGVRSLRDWLDPENADKTMTRGDDVNALAAIFYYERESRWYRRIVRFFRHLPQVKSVIAELANGHARGLEAAKAQLAEQVEHAQKSAAAFKAGAEASK